MDSALMSLLFLPHPYLCKNSIVPLNDALAIAKPDNTDGASLWASYLTNWTIWNHVRTIAALAAAALLTIALCDRAVQ